MKLHRTKCVLLTIVAIFAFIVVVGCYKASAEAPAPKVVKQKSKLNEPARKNSIQKVEAKEEKQNIEIQATKVEVVEKKDGYTSVGLRVRKEPNTNSEVLDVYPVNTKISYEIENDQWVKIDYNGEQAFMNKNFISDNMVEVKIEEPKKEIVQEKQEVVKEATNNQTSGKNYNNNAGGRLTRSGGVFYGPSGKETYYNLNMSGVINIMRKMGNNDEYWVRDDGAKMLGNYVMVAANLNVHPRGSLVPTSLGMGIVCDTGGFASNGSGVALDIATAW